MSSWLDYTLFNGTCRWYPALFFFFSKLKGIKVIQTMFMDPNKINLKTDNRKTLPILPALMGHVAAHFPVSSPLPPALFQH